VIEAPAGRAVTSSHDRSGGGTQAHEPGDLVGNQCRRFEVRQQLHGEVTAPWWDDGADRGILKERLEFVARWRGGALVSPSPRKQLPSTRSPSRVPSAAGQVVGHEPGRVERLTIFGHEFAVETPAVAESECQPPGVLHLTEPR
jgi:hypothetical protein